MKKTLIILMFLAALAGLAAVPCAAEEAPDEPGEPEKAEWTVMFYFCGSDLESKYGYATLNLKEMLRIMYPYDMKIYYGDQIPEEEDSLRDIGEVNVLIETGGAGEWHTGEAGFTASADNVQRWRIHYMPAFRDGKMQYCSGMELLETLPQQSMGRPETLTDYIRWSTQNYPAEKYALVLWGHGMGAGTGIFADENFGGDVMYLYELKQALADAGTYLDDVIIDACMMANIETALAISGSARWMVASEDEVPGRGSAMGDWLQALIDHPSLDGEWLGKCICDMTSAQYASEPDGMAKSLMTWSVTDLTKIGRLVETTEKFYREMGIMLREVPAAATVLSKYIFKTEEYGDGQDHMRDLGSLFYHPKLIGLTDNRMLDEVLDALSDAVVYNVHGSGRGNSRGLSFCYPADFSEAELDKYADNYPAPAYLAFLDAISVWSAPGWVYEQTERLPHISTIGELQVTIEKITTKDGMPALSFHDSDSNLDDLYYRLYRLEEETGELIRLGTSDCDAAFSEKDGMIVWLPEDLTRWPAIEGTTCCIDLIQSNTAFKLYNIPIQINTETVTLRCGRTDTVAEDGITLTPNYQVYGVWEGYEESGNLPNRSVEPLAIVAGREYRLLYPKEKNGKQKATYSTGRPRKMLRALNVELLPLPAGTYYLEYELRDMFMRTKRLERIPFTWDGEEIAFPEDLIWEGRTEVIWN